MFRLDAPAEFVTLHVAAMVRVPNPELGAFAPSPGTGRAVKERRRVDFDEDGVHETVVVERGRLGLEEIVEGPAIVEESAATTVIYPGQRAWLDRGGNLVIQTGA